MTACRYVPDWGYYLPSHEATCRDNECDGCAPCTERHCTGRENCTSHLEPGVRHTCPRCIGKVRRNIRDIAGWYAEDLPEEALEAGVDSEAANLAGPAADPIIAHWKLTVAERVALDPGDLMHPLTVLGNWEMMLREDYDQDYSELPPITVAGAATYLTAILDTVAQDPEQDWALFASEVAGCRHHLAAVLHELRRSETGAPCPACEAAPKLVKRWFPHSHADDWNPEQRCEACEKGDAWVCPSCKALWSEVEYRRWVADDYLTVADQLTAADAEIALGISATRIRVWGARGLVEKRGRNAHGITLYDVEQIKRRAGDETLALRA